MAPYKTETADSLVICSHCGASLDCGETAIKAADGRFCSVECAQAAARARRNRRARENRWAREAAYRACGLKKVRGMLGGTYWE